MTDTLCCDAEQSFFALQFSFGKLWKGAKDKRPAKAKPQAEPISMEMSDFRTPSHSRASSCSSQEEVANY